LQIQEVGDFEVLHVRDLPPLNPARAGHKASFNPDPSGNRQFFVGAVSGMAFYFCLQVYIVGK